jgi:F-type H+-transporting ATPase subunit delta
VKISKQARRDAKQLFRSCQVNGLLDDDRVRRAVQSVVARKPRGHVAALAHFQRLVKLDLERRRTRVESATPLSPALQAGIQASLARHHGPGLTFSFGQNPALIGGLRVQVGSDVYDGSVRGRLNALAEGL